MVVAASVDSRARVVMTAVRCAEVVAREAAMLAEPGPPHNLSVTKRSWLPGSVSPGIGGSMSPGAPRRALDSTCAATRRVNRNIRHGRRSHEHLRQHGQD